MKCAAVIAFAGVALAAMPAARAQDVIEQWTQVKTPPAPALQPVAADQHSTALLLLDFVRQTCSNERRPRCVASIPMVAKLLRSARVHHVHVIYSGVTGRERADVLPEVASHQGEPMVFSGPDKFLHTRLDSILRVDGISTVIVTGTAAEGAVLATAGQAAYRGYSVIVPVDGMSSATLYPEQYVAWDLLHAPSLAGNVILTSTAMITFNP